jgi:hypothetical protein
MLPAVAHAIAADDDDAQVRPQGEEGWQGSHEDVEAR